MTRATLRLSIPEGVWIGDCSRAVPDARIRILAAIADGPAGVALAEVRADDPRAVLDRMAHYEAVTELEVLRSNEDTTLCQFETTLPLLLVASRDSGVPVEMPFDIVDGEATWTVSAPRDRIAELRDQLEALGVSVTVERIGGEDPPDPLLTDRQADLVETAVERGYYDTPRTCTLTELAEAMGLAKSTVSEVLHRAEGTLAKRHVATDGTPRGRERPVR